MVKDITTCRISTEVGDKLRESGKMGEIYDDVIRRLVQIAREREKR